MTNTDNKAENSEVRDPQRLLAFSDGVYAVAITLLILSITTPQLKDVPGSKLLPALLQQWPSWLSYIISFLAVGIGWINHHEMFRQIKHVDVTLLALNLLVLLFTTIFPVPTRLLAEYIQDADGQRIAAVFYGLNLLCLSVAYYLVWYYAVRAGLLGQEYTPGELRQRTRQQAREILVGIIAVVIAIISPPLSIAVYLGLAVYYFVSGYSR